MNEGHIVKKVSKKGHEVIIRYPKRDDLDDFLRFANDIASEDTYIMLCETISREKEEKWLTDTLEQIAKGEKIHLIALVDGTFVGNCEIRVGNRRKKHSGEIGISVQKDARDKGIGTILLESLIEEGKKFGLKLLMLHCFETNQRALHVYEKLGFRKAGLVPDAIYYKKEYIGEVTMYLSLVKTRHDSGLSAIALAKAGNQ